MTGKLETMVDERELEEMKGAAKAMGFKNVGDYVMGRVRFTRNADTALKRKT